MVLRIGQCVTARVVAIRGANVLLEAAGNKIAVADIQTRWVPMTAEERQPLSERFPVGTETKVVIIALPHNGYWAGSTRLAHPERNPFIRMLQKGLDVRYTVRVSTCFPPGDLLHNEELAVDFENGLYAHVEDFPWDQIPREKWPRPGDTMDVIVKRIDAQNGDIWVTAVLPAQTSL